ncbi:DUF2272 domain-containing protein [Aromatoleum diolicum]|uniref:DUF2272 domain-containing protein n=1 Tax=Aromatoleum diolicum TaxID=75796 RepID=A0ABX1QCW2_9RHOO|nr:DUF2272 domain-containing protein [Aromatoleum diolicum]
MSVKFVDFEALNLRSKAVLAPATRIGILHLGQQVEELEPDIQGDWVKIKAEVDGVQAEGVVKSVIDGKRSLRDPASASREALVGEAIKEWLRFEKGQGLEHHAPFFDFVGEMWRAIGLDLDGKDRDTPWSAAAISFMVRNAAERFPKYAKFKFAASHSRYMHASIVKRNAGDMDVPFWGFRLHEKRPEIGDIVGRWRETPRDFDDAETSDSFKSHTDIIVSVDSDSVLAIGGNVRQSVSISRYDKTGAGFLAATNGVFMHMVNRT